MREMKTMWYLLTDSSGKKSVSYTMMLVTFLVCTVWLMLSVFESIAGMHVREFSAEAATFWFSPTAALYFGRKRWPGTKKASKVEKPEEDSVVEELSKE